MDRRTIARELTMQALCQLDVQGSEAESTLVPGKRCRPVMT
ncbi:MAG: hypothetical protein ACYSQY_15130 [Planctomycetota bacterium]